MVNVAKRDSRKSTQMSNEQVVSSSSSDISLQDVISDRFLAQVKAGVAYDAASLVEHVVTSGSTVSLAIRSMHERGGAVAIAQLLKECISIDGITPEELPEFNELANCIGELSTSLKGSALSPSKKMLSRKEAAQLLNGKSVNTITNWVKAKRLIGIIPTEGIDKA